MGHVSHALPGMWPPIIITSTYIHVDMYVIHVLIYINYN